MAIDFPTDRSNLNPALPAGALENGDTTLIGNTLYTFVIKSGKSWWSGAQGVNLDNRYVEVSGDTMTGNLTVPSLNGYQIAGDRNQIINGDLQIWQRGASKTNLAIQPRHYMADMISSDIVAASSGWQRNPGPAAYGIAWLLRFTTAGFSGLRIPMECPRNTSSELTNGKFKPGTQWTISFISSRNDLTNRAPVVAFRDTTNQSADQVKLTASFDDYKIVDQKGGYTRYSSTFTVDAGVTPAATNTHLCAVVLSDQYKSVANDEFTGFQLEPGPVATPFEHVNYSTQLARCQRYFYRLRPNSNLGTTTAMLTQTSGGVARGLIPTPVSMWNTDALTVERIGTGWGNFVLHGRTNGGLKSEDLTNLTIPGYWSYSNHLNIQAAYATGSFANFDTMALRFGGTAKSGFNFYKEF